MSFITALMAGSQMVQTAKSGQKKGMFKAAGSNRMKQALAKAQLEGGYRNYEEELEDDRQVRLQQRLNNQAAQLNYDFGEQAADNAFQRQKAMYEQQLKDNREWDNETAKMKRNMQAVRSVGGNPMMALMGNVTPGAGGSAEFATAPIGGGAGSAISSGQAPTSVDHTDAQTRRMQATQDAIRTAKEIALLGAQKKNIDADTNLKGAEENKLTGADTKLIMARIDEIAAGIRNTDLRSDILEIDKEIKGATKEAEINYAYANLRSVIEDIGVKGEQQRNFAKQREQIDAQIKEIDKRTRLLEDQSVAQKIENALRYGTFKEQVALNGIIALAEASARINNLEQNTINQQWEAIGKIVDVANWENKLPAMTQILNMLKNATGSNNYKEGSDAIATFMGWIVNPLSIVNDAVQVPFKP